MNRDYSILKKIVWDYDISLDDINKCLDNEIETAGFYTKEKLIIKILGNLYWYEIIKILTLSDIKKFLTVENIKKIYPKELQIKYEYLRRILHKESLSSSGWNSETGQFPQYTILSDRWYSVKQGIL